MEIKFYIIIGLIGVFIVLGMLWLFINYYKNSVKNKPEVLKDDDVYGTESPSATSESNHTEDKAE